METLSVNVPAVASSYKVLIGADLLGKFPALFDITKYSSIAIVYDKAIESTWLPKLKSALPAAIHTFAIRSGEKSKDIDSLKFLWDGFAQARLDRGSLIINLGGGMVCDLGGFAASTYLRGVDFVHVPTTLLSQVDASIGGKTGINVIGAKNLAGTFAAPAAVIMDVETLSTLPQSELNSGYAEIIKHGLIADSKLFEVLSAGASKTLDYCKLIELVTRSCQIKQQIVESDFREAGKRQLLNFGHTLGHAIEGASHLTNNPLLHGEAVSIGMVGEAYLSMKFGKVTQSDLTGIEQILANHGLPIRLPAAINKSEVEKLLALDKKRTNSQLRWVMLEKIGSAAINFSISPDLVSQAITFLQEG